MRRLNFHDQEHIDDPKCRGHDDEEVLRENRLGMIPHEGHPLLRWDLGPFWVLGYVTTEPCAAKSEFRPSTRAHSRCSSPRVGLSEAISTINLRTSVGTLGLPLDRDFHFQKNRKPFRCQRINVSGFTTVRIERQSKNLVS
jgi:hypothetical protein